MISQINAAQVADLTISVSATPSTSTSADPKSRTRHNHNHVHLESKKNDIQVNKNEVDPQKCANSKPRFHTEHPNHQKWGIQGNIPESFCSGMLVNIQGIKSKPELNNKQGYIMHFNETTERWAVRLRGGAKLCFKADSLAISKLPACPGRLGGAESILCETTRWQINEYHLEESRKMIQKIMATSDENEISSNMYIEHWVNDKRPVSCFVITNQSNNTTAFALLSKMDFDPLFDSKSCYCLDYIYTFEEYRRHGFAKQLVNHLKTFKNPLIPNSSMIYAHCTCEKSEQLFSKCGYTQVCISPVIKTFVWDPNTHSKLTQA